MSNQIFHKKLYSLMAESLKNYHSDNFNEEYFGKQSQHLMTHLRKRLSSLLFPSHINKYHFIEVMQKTNEILEVYGSKLDQVYSLLANDESKEWLVRLIAYKILGHEKVKLPTNNPTFFSVRDSQKKFLNLDHFVEVFFLGKKRNLYLADLTSIGINLKVYSAVIDYIFIREMHRYKDIVVAEEGDVVLDCGACYGDSGLYFANLVGRNGKVFSFEFIPNQIVIFNENLRLNPSLQGIVNLVEYPLWEKKGKKVYFKDGGPGSRVAFAEFDGFEGVTETQTIDDFYNERRLSKVDFIKMDIEGAEPYALRGGERVIRSHKPKLAIASYHSLDDFVNIPLWIHSLELGYKIYLDHSTIHWDETIVFAAVEDKGIG